ncbi:33895_t:CDS:1, partial [Gigaspora margarita]
ENISNGNNPTTSADTDVTVNKETLQALLSLLEAKKEDETHDQMTFISLREGEGPLYLLAERCEWKKHFLRELTKKPKNNLADLSMR